MSDDNQIADWDFEEYRAANCVNATALKAAQKSLAHASAVLRGELDLETPSMARGTAVHAAILEPDAFTALYALGPDCRRGTKEWNAAEQAAAGRTLMKPDDFGEVMAMRRSLWACEPAARLIRRCTRREVSLLWRDVETGLRCKARVDLWSPELGVIADLKTATSAEPGAFARQSYTLGYHIQLAHYLAGLRACGERAAAVGVVVVETSAPFVPCIFEPDEAWLQAGEDARRRALNAIAEAQNTGHWPGYMADNQPKTLSLPAWAEKA